jgi:hypothetical protein
VLKEITERGPLMPRDFDFQQRKEEWKGSWFGPSVTKQTLRALWHTGMIMTSGRKNGQHIYDLTERIVPKPFLDAPTIDGRSARRELVLERHRALGIVRPSAPPEIWSYTLLHPTKMDSLAELLAQGAIVPVEVEGMKAHATPEFLDLLDQPSIKPRVVFIGPLDQFMWDRKMIAHVFGFDYVWEVYVPEKKRRWGYYVLPVLFGDELIARVEFYCRNGGLEIRQWHFQQADVSAKFLSELERSLRNFMKYCSAESVRAEKHIDKRIRDLTLSFL